ncbi:hypothetical protein ABZ614_41640 [Streptomyces sp. NPDC013178]|uniref:hypothetical protein n=1 Tax=Streptomyces sp. NPDC013178 TaxID=3155118 RepID=UPI0033E64952
MPEPAPNMRVGWETPPSFNDEPNSPPGESNSDAGVVDSGPFRFDAPVVRETEGVLLAQSRNAIADYEALRSKVAGIGAEGFWGPKKPEAPVAAYNPSNQSPGASFGAPSMEEQEKIDLRLLSEIGAEFAGHINPVMQDALNMVSNSLELLGNYIGMVNASGQVYSRIDRSMHFPEPPGGMMPQGRAI